MCRDYSHLAVLCSVGRGALAALVLGIILPGVRAQQPRTVAEGVYSDSQAKRGQALYRENCAPCHAATLAGGVGPPLTGSEFNGQWGGRSLADLAAKIRNTMPPNDQGKITAPQAVELVAHILQTAKYPAGTADLPADDAGLRTIVFSKPRPQAGAAAATHTPAFPPAGNLTQVMRGILFPSSNIIFNVQTNDPSEAVKTTPTKSDPSSSFSWVNWGAGIYQGWEIVDYAAIAVAESAPLMLTPGRRCENGRPVPVTNPDWIKFSEELAEAGRAAYRASQTRNQEAVSDVSNQLADACLHCHEVYRDKPGGTVDDPSNKAMRCVPYKPPAK
jgi:mono/diheme cytochrome c family protein